MPYPSARPLAARNAEQRAADHLLEIPKPAPLNRDLPKDRGQRNKHHQPRQVQENNTPPILRVTETETEPSLLLERFDLLQAPARPARRHLNRARELGIIARLGPDPLARTAKSCADFSVGKPNFICHLFLVFT